MQGKRVGIVGHGHFGKFLAELAVRFLPETEVRIYSRRAPIDNKKFFPLEEVAQSDAVILCGAISEYEAQLQALAPLLLPTTVVVDVATVKVHTEALFLKYLKNQPYVCLHPMFGPESYEKREGNVTGLRAVVTAHTLPKEIYEQFNQVLTVLGFRVVEMTSDEHDRFLAETLFLTHYVSQSILTAGFDRTLIDTASFASLMDAVESVKNDRQLFEDVYRFNPYCKAVAERLHTAQEAVWQSIQK